MQSTCQTLGTLAWKWKIWIESVSEKQPPNSRDGGQLRSLLWRAPRCGVQQAGLSPFRQEHTQQTRLDRIEENLELIGIYRFLRMWQSSSLENLWIFGAKSRSECEKIYRKKLKSYRNGTQPRSLAWIGRKCCHQHQSGRS